MKLLLNTCLIVGIGFLIFTPLLNAQMPANYQLGSDWLIDQTGFESEVQIDETKGTFVLSNGLVSRVIDSVKAKLYLRDSRKPGWFLQNALGWMRKIHFPSSISLSQSEFNVNDIEQ